MYSGDEFYDDDVTSGIIDVSRGHKTPKHKSARWTDPNRTETTMSDTKTCNGLVGIPAHDAPLDGFGSDAHNKDGLARYCKTCMTAYNQDRRNRKALANPSAVPLPRQRKQPTILDVKSTTEVIEAMTVRELETDQGQAALATAADAAAAARRSARNEQQRLRRAAAKAAADQPQA